LAAVSMKKPGFYFLLIMSLLTAWTVMLGVLSYKYVAGLTKPYCPPALEQRPGYQSYTLQTKDGYQLRGWYHPPQNGAVIILLAGNGGSRDAMLPDADLLARHGYGSMTVEYRNCAGGPSTLGYREAEDVQELAKFASGQPEVKWLGVMGFSAGGVAAIRGAAQIPEIQAVVSEGNYYSLDYEIRNSNPAPLTLEWQIQNLVILWYRMMEGIWPAEVNPAADLVLINPRPVLLVYGEGEITNNRGYEQSDLLRTPRQLWVVPGVSHGGYAQKWPDEYENIIINFFDKASNP
jgi:uncharacterized protein